MNNIFNYYMRVYCHFLSVDIINSLNKSGRDKRIIFDIYKTLVVVVNKKVDESTSKKAISILERTILEYQSKYLSDTYNKKAIDTLKCNETKTKVNFSFFKYFEKNILSDFKLFTDATNLFQELSKTSQFEISKDEEQNSKELIHLQSIVEFNNAMAHIYKAYYLPKKEDLVTNLKRAKTHLHRGTLDIYKTLIIHQNNQLPPKLRLKIVNMRLNEVQSIGSQVFNKSKSNVLIEYQNIVKEIYKK